MCVVLDKNFSLPKMVKDSSNALSFSKHNKHICVKLGISLLLMGLACRFFFFSDSLIFSSSQTMESIETQTTESNPKTKTKTTELGRKDSFDPLALPPQPDTPLPLDFPYNDIQSSQNETKEEDKATNRKCDIFKGEWIPDSAGPRYTNESCRVIESHQNCMKNGRPDSGYFYWRWSPKDCDLPSFDARKFLDQMRHKSWAFIGDSISRNHVQSFICILSQVEEAVEVYHDEEYRSKRWIFPSHNLTVSVIWSPFLIKADIFEDMNGISNSTTRLHLDKLDEAWTDQFDSHDYAVIAGGKWFLKTAIYHENGSVTGCHYCPGKNLTDLGFQHAYRKALGLALSFITNQKPKSRPKPVVFFRTTTPDHFENGEWFSGGYCNRTMPFREDEVEMRDVDVAMREVELEEFEKAAEGKVVLRLLDTTRISLLRPDGHPGPYRQFHPFKEDQNAKVQTDCLHWCLPGPIDYWNDLVMELLVNGDKYR